MYASWFYRKSPVWVQESLLSLRGRIRAGLRERHAFEQVRSEIDATQWMPAPDLERFKVDTLRKLLDHAGRRVPYYRQRFSRHGFRGVAIRDIAELAQLPILRKKEVMASYQAFLAEGHRGIKIPGQTSGTTGSPFELYQDLSAISREHAFIRRQMQWAGYGAGDRRVWFRGDLVVPVDARRGPYWRFNRADNMLMMSSYHLSEDRCPAYIEALKKFDPVLIQAYPSSIGYLARWLWNRGVTVDIPSLRGVLTSSETLTDEQRQHIETVFGVRVFDWYGSSERVAAIGTCEHGNYHIISDYGLTELVPAEDGTSEIVGTGFGNFLMPLIRYGSGDCVTPADPDERCACGRAFPLVRHVWGRMDDVVKLPDGRSVGGCLQGFIFKGIHCVTEAQIVQERLDAVDIRVVPAGELEETARLQIIAQARERLGDEMAISVTPVPEIARTRNGKLRGVVSRV